MAETRVPCMDRKPANTGVQDSGLSHFSMFALGQRYRITPYTVVCSIQTLLGLAGVVSGGCSTTKTNEQYQVQYNLGH